KSGGSRIYLLRCPAFVAIVVAGSESKRPSVASCAMVPPCLFIFYSSCCHQKFTLCAYNGRSGDPVVTSRPLSAVEQSVANPAENPEDHSLRLEPSRKYPGALIV